MSDLHIFCELGAIGDTAFNFCRAHAAMEVMGHEKAVVHSAKQFQFGKSKTKIPNNPDVIEIWNNCNFLKEIVYDIDYNDASSFDISKTYGCKIEQPMIFRENHNILNWIDLRKYLPEVPDDKPTVIFQPISLEKKIHIVAPEHLDSYIPVWKRCINLLLEKNYRIIMVGGKDDPIHLCVEKKQLPYLDNKIGKWTVLQALAFTLHKANLVLSCDSWVGIWGIAAQKKTAIAWGYRYENDIDYWVTNFLGNRNFYKNGWSSQKDDCDAILAAYLSNIINSKR